MVVGQLNQVDYNGSDESADVASKIETLEDQFNNLQTRIINELSAKPDVTVREVLSQLTSLPLSLRKEYESSIAKRIPSMRTETQVNELFIVHLNPLTSFIDYRLIEHVIRKFGSDGLKIDMQSYCCDMQTFMQHTTIKQLINYFPGQPEIPPKFSLVEAKIGEDASKCTLEQLNTIRRRYCSEVKLSEIIFHLVAVVESNSFIVRWIIPLALVSDIMKSSQNLDKRFYQKYIKITSLTLDGMWLFLSEAEIDAMWLRVHMDDTKFKDKIHTMYKQMLFELEMQGISEHDLLLHLMDHRPHFRDYLSKVFHKYDFLLSLVGYKTLATIIERFGSDCLKGVMKSYSKYVKSICSRQLTVQQLIALSPVLPKPSKYFIIAECRFVEKPLEYVFEKLLCFQTRFCNMLNVNKLCFVMSEMSMEVNDSFIIRWIIPSAITARVVKLANNAEPSLYQAYRIISVTVSTMWLYLSEAEIDKMWSQVHVSDTRFKDQFHTMYKQIVCELKIGEILEHDLSTYLMEQQPKLQKQVSDHLSEVILKCECPSSFIDFRVLTIIIERFGSNCLKRVMRSCCKYMSAFTKQSTVQQLIDLPPVQSKPSKYFIRAKCMIEEEPSGYRLERLLCLQSELCCILDIDEVCFVVNEVNTEMSGSFTVSWLIPSSLISNIMKSASNIPYQQYKIISFILDSMWLYLGESEISALWSVSNVKFKDQFHTIHKQILCELEIEEVSENNFSLYLMNQPPKVDSKISLHISKAFLEQKPSSFGILSIIIERFGSDCLKRVMKSFCEQSTVQQLIDLSVVQLKDFITAECRIMEEPSQYILEKLLTFQTRFCTFFNISNICFNVIKICNETSGSFTVVWLVPSSLAFDLLKAANHITDIGLFQEFNISSLQLGSGWLYHYQLIPLGARLKKRYQQSQGSASPVEWIPSPTKKIFRLAMIQRERVQRGRIEDRFVRMTISGRVDDILHAKSPVELEYILGNMLYGGEIVLIEGAPGSGKSTLTVHICQRWGKGELFQQFTVVILVQLRDPVVQRAQTIADLLPVENAQEIAAEIIATNGCGLLWVFDGWDELPHHLQQDSIFRKLLPPKHREEKLKEIKEDPLYAKYVKKRYNDEDLWNVYLQNNPQNDRLLLECSVIVTSRPISSGDLHPVVSSRFEVLGFTPEEQRQYFTECLRGDIKALEALLKKIQENPMVQSICYLPLNAAFVVHTFKYKCQSLPNTEYEIYLSVILSCIQRHFEREGRGHNLPKELSSVDDLSRSEAVREPFQFLCELAYRGVMENKVTFSSIDLPQGSNTLSLLQAIESFLQSGKSVFYNFLHLSIQEVLSAYYIATWLSDSEQVSRFRQLFNQPRFAAVFQFYAAITKLKSPGIHNVIDGIICKKSKPLIVSLLRCLHEAQDPSLCLFVAERLWYRLDLGGSSLSPLDCLSIGFFLSSIAGKEVSIKLFQCYISDLGAKCLTKFVGSDISKVSINLNDNNIHEEGARMLLFFEHVYLSHNPIGDIGASLISEAMKGAITLKTLVLSWCNFTLRGAEGLSRALAQNSSLEILDITGNNLGDEGISYVAEALKQNKHLKELWIGNCGVTDKGAASLASALSVNNSLKMLHMGGDKGTLTGHGLSTITQSLANKREFVKLTISQDFEYISDHLTHEVNEARKRNGLLPIEIIGEYHVLDCAMGVK